MSTIYTISDKALVGKQVNYLSAYICECFFKNNIKINTQSILPTNTDFNKLLSEKNNEDIIVFLVDKSQNKLNQALCDKTKSVMVCNPYLKNQITSFYKKMNAPVEKESENECVIPSLAKAVVNPNGIIQGYILDSEKTAYIVLPTNIYESRQMFDDVILDFVVSKQKKHIKSYVFKTFGLSENTIRNVINQEKSNKISLNLFSKPLSVDIIIKSSDESGDIDEFAKNIYLKLNKYIYAVEDMPIEKIIFNLLKLNDITISVVEDCTGGEICSRINLASDDETDCIKEGLILFNFQSKMNTLKLDDNFFNENDEISANTVYEMAVKEIERTNSNLVVVCSGLLNEKNRNPKGLCFIAVGDKKEIHVFKNLFKGSNDDIVDGMVEASYFYLLKKLNKNDFHFEQTTV